MFSFNNYSNSKSRRHGHDIGRGDGRGPLKLGGDRRRPCNPRDPLCGMEDPRRERYRREGLGRDDSLFEPRRGSFQGGPNLAGGPLGGLVGAGLLGGLGTLGGGLGSLGGLGALGGGGGIPGPLFAGPGYAEDLADLNHRGPPLGIPISELSGMGVGGGLRGLQQPLPYGYGRPQPQLYDYEVPMMMQQQQFANSPPPRTPLIDSRIPYFDERALGGYQRENLLNSPLGLHPRESPLLRGRGLSMQMNPMLSPLRSGSSSIRSGRSGRGMQNIPMMAGGLGGFGGPGFGNYRPPYVEDYESEIDELERAMREQDWAAHGFVLVEDDGTLGGRRL